MNKYVLTTALSIASTAAFAQNNDAYSYDYGYEFQPSYGSEYNSNVYQQDYYTNQPIQQTNSYVAAKPVEPQAGNEERPWSAHILLGATSTPEYMGAKDNDVQALILPTFQYKLDPWQRLFISIDEGAGYGYKLTNNLEIGGGLTYRKGRDSSDAFILSGLDDVDDTLAYSAFAKYKFDKNYRLGIQFTKGIDESNDGMSTELFAGYARMLTPKTGIDLFINTKYGDDTFMEQNFGVKSGEATAFRSAYNADAGFYKANLRASINHNLGGPHSITAFTNYSMLLGDAKDSSVVEDEKGVSVGAGYTYKF